MNKNHPYFFLLVIVAIAFFFSPPNLYSTQLPEGFAELEIAAELDPVAMALAPDGRIFLAEKNGRISIIRDDELLPNPFLQLEVDNFNERGLQSIVLHPDFDTNNFIYFFYMSPGDNFNKVTRWVANGDFAVPGSEETLYEMDLVFGPNHNGGGMQFGLDKHLYIATGDGVDGSTPQDMTNTGGKVIRLQDDGTIPTDNPFYNSAEGKYKAIWSIGLRNPFTVSVQPNTGRLFFCDVGESLWEEINEIEKGKNYGWPFAEGFYQGSSPPPDYQDPIYAYAHDPDCAIVGATFYDPVNTQFPPRYHGQFFFMDYCTGYIKVMNPDNGTIAETFATEIDRPIALMVDHEGAMYYLARAGMGGGSPQDNTSSDNGRLMKIIYTGSGAPFISRQPASILLPENESATFSVVAFGDQPITYQWIKDGTMITGATADTYVFENTTLADDDSRFSCRITNSINAVNSDVAILSVTVGTRPQPDILFPEPNATYVAGENISFSGAAFDAEEGNLDSATFQWKVDFHHLDHTHPAMSPLAGVSSGSLEIPQVGEISDEVWYRIYLTATDIEGLSQSTYRDVFPEKTTFVLESEPSGLKISADGLFEATPLPITSVKGIQRSLVAPYSQIKNDSLFLFEKWDNGSTDPFFQFFADDDIGSVKAFFKGRPMAGGTGLLGEYFDYVDEAPNFDQEPKFTRKDLEINFNWVLGSPNEWELGVDSFLVRWTGSIQPLFDELYTFHLNADDGVRLWIDEELIIDRWDIQDNPEETTGTKLLENGNLYKFRLEYFEDKKNARAILSWSSNSTPKQVIPVDQLFPKFLSNTDEIAVSIFPNPVTDQLTLQILSRGQPDIIYRIFDTSGRQLFRLATRLNRIVSILDFDTHNFAPGIYYLKIDAGEFEEVLPFSKM